MALATMAFPTATIGTMMVALTLPLMLLFIQPSNSAAFSSIDSSPAFSHHSSSSLFARSMFSPSILSSRKSSSLPQPSTSRTIIQLSSTWDNFAYDDDDDDLEDAQVLLLDTPTVGDTKNFIPADENDDPSVKAAAGMALQPPDVDYDGPIINVPQGSTLELDEETVQGVLAACRQEIGTMFGYQAENRGVGITGGVDFVELDGPTVVLHLKGRFWHQRTTVLKRVGAYLMARIPEIVDVIVADEYELTDEANNDS